MNYHSCGKLPPKAQCFLCAKMCTLPLFLILNPSTFAWFLTRPPPQIHGDTLLLQLCIPPEWNSKESSMSLEETKHVRAIKCARPTSMRQVLWSPQFTDETIHLMRERSGF